MENNSTEIDLFEQYETLPSEVQKIIMKYSEVGTYQGCEEFLKELKPYGYTFDYYLSAEPFNLRKI